MYMFPNKSNFFSNVFNKGEFTTSVILPMDRKGVINKKETYYLLIKIIINEYFSIY